MDNMQRQLRTESLNVFGARMEVVALREADIFGIAAEFSDKIGKFVDTLPSYEIDVFELSNDIASKVVADAPQLTASILRHGVRRDTSGTASPEYDGIVEVLALRQVLALTMEFHGDALGMIVLSAIAQCSAYLSGARH